LIKTLGLTELVSDAPASRKQNEAETNVKIVDLFKDELDEIKNCRTEQQGVEFHIALVRVMSPREEQFYRKTQLLNQEEGRERVGGSKVLLRRGGCSSSKEGMDL